MTLPDAHLLRLPREVRDQILTNPDLCHEILFNWKWKVRGKYRVGIKVTIPHAPCTNLLSVCSRVHDEYRELLQRPGLPSRVMFIEWSGKLVRGRALESLRKDRKLVPAFDYPTTVLVKITMDEPLVSSLSRESWDRAADFVEVLQANMPQVSSVIVSTRLSSSEPFKSFVTPHIEEHLDWRPSACENTRPIPDMLGDLHVQHTSCLYRLAARKNTCYRKPYPSDQPEEPRKILWSRFHYTDWNYPVYHYIKRFEAYTYVREGSKVPKLDAETLSAFWSETEFTTADIDPDWDLHEKYVQIEEEYERRVIGWEEVDREEMMASRQTFHLSRKAYEREKRNANEDEGFALWFD
jgi:hypothetical protein